MDFKELEDKCEQIGRLKALRELEAKIEEESIQKQIILDNGMVFSGKIINSHALLRIINKMAEEV